MANETSHSTVTVRSISRRWLSPALFALIGLAFFLPFATVSCDGAKTTFTGVQLVTHTIPEGGVVDEPPDCSAHIGTCVEHKSSGTATIALISAVLGLALGLLGIAKGPGWCATIGFGAIAVLPGEGGILGPDVAVHSGYDLALYGFLLVGLVHVRRAWVRRKQHRTEDENLEAPSATGAAGHAPARRDCLEELMLGGGKSSPGTWRSSPQRLHQLVGINHVRLDHLNQFRANLWPAILDGLRPISSQFHHVTRLSSSTRRKGIGNGMT